MTIGQLLALYAIVHGCRAPGRDKLLQALDKAMDAQRAREASDDPA